MMILMNSTMKKRDDTTQDFNYNRLFSSIGVIVMFLHCPTKIQNPYYASSRQDVLFVQPVFYSIGSYGETTSPCRIFELARVCHPGVIHDLRQIEIRLQLENDKKTASAGISSKASRFNCYRILGSLI